MKKIIRSKRVLINGLSLRVTKPARQLAGMLAAKSRMYGAPACPSGPAPVLLEGPTSLGNIRGEHVKDRVEQSTDTMNNLWG